MSTQEGDYVEGSFNWYNVVGSSEHRKNWSKFWSEHTGKSFDSAKCSNYRCGNSADVGAHVWLKEHKTRKFCFIIPLCQSCNMCSDNHYHSKNQDWKKTKSNVRAVYVEAHSNIFK